MGALTSGAAASAAATSGAVASGDGTSGDPTSKAKASYRIGWLSPLTPTSGVGTFSSAVASHFPESFKGEAIDLTLLYVGHDKLYQSDHRAIQIGDGEDFRQILTLFDLLIYNIGNNREHHEAIFNLLRIHPGIIVCHDYVYQHYLADRSLRGGKSFASFAALLLKYGDAAAIEYLRRSRITSRLGRVRYSPWDSEASASQPMSDSVLALGSALIVHSSFARRHAEQRFAGPVLQLGMPHDQKPANDIGDLSGWIKHVANKPCFELVSFGHIQPTKCIDLVIAALAASPTLRKRIRYTVAGFVGDFAYYDRLKAMVAARALQGCVSFELDVSEARLRELLHKADIFSNLRRPNTEGSSVSLIEQLDTGKPVIVLNSGCYADLPHQAAIKLPPDVTPGQIREALELLTDNPTAMPVIGSAGRAHARSWTCESYARGLVHFAYENRALLEQRARNLAIRTRLVPDAAPTDAWTRDLARARASLAYLDRNILSTDPAIVLTKTNEEICDYVANVLFGIFTHAQLTRALSRFFARLDRSGTYWGCVRFALIADAVFGEDETARQRLSSLRPCHDPEFWAVIEALPPRQFIAAATLILMKRMPREDELATSGLDDRDGFPKRLRIVELVRGLKPAPGSSLERLGRWLELPCFPALERALPTLEEDVECAVGSPTFKDHADLSGFYAMETDHAWTRGPQGFLGVRLGARPIDIDVQVRHVAATPERPSSIGLSYHDVATSTKVEDNMPRWLSIALPAGHGSPATIAWLQLSADYAAAPPNSSDTRLLGICCLQLRIKLRPSIAARSGRPSLRSAEDAKAAIRDHAGRSLELDASRPIASSAGR